MLAARLHVRGQDVPDVLQEIFVKLLSTLPNFEYDSKKGRFRGYLRQVCCTKVADWRRKQPGPAANEAELSGQVDERAAAELAQVWQQDHNRFLVRRALVLMQAEFQSATWKACWEFVANGKAAAAVAAELGISENAVFIAKFRVIRRLKEELEGLFEE